MQKIIEGTPCIPISAAAEELMTTHLRILMLLKHKVLAGSSVDGEWYIDRNSLDCLKSHGIKTEERAECRSSCAATACGCKGR